MPHLSEYPHKIFISFPFSNRNSAQIPVPPETISGGTGSIISTYNLITIGEVLAQGGVKLERVKWESHFPKIYDSSISVIAERDHINPLAWRDLFVFIQRKQTFVNVAIQNTPIDMRMGVVNFKWAFVPGPSGDIWYQLELIEDKQGQIREFDGIRFPEPSNREPPSTVEDSLSIPESDFSGFGDPPFRFRTGDRRLYIVQTGDTLMGIAQKVYGKSHLWALILDANRDLLMGNVVRSSRIPPVSSVPLAGEPPRDEEVIITRYVGGVLPDGWVLDDPILKKELQLSGPNPSGIGLVTLYIPVDTSVNLDFGSLFDDSEVRVN